MDAGHGNDRSTATVEFAWGRRRRTRAPGGASARSARGRRPRRARLLSAASARLPARGPGRSMSVEAIAPDDATGVEAEWRRRVTAAAPPQTLHRGRATPRDLAHAWRVAAATTTEPAPVGYLQVERVPLGAAARREREGSAHGPCRRPQRFRPAAGADRRPARTPAAGMAQPVRGRADGARIADGAATAMRRTRRERSRS